MVERGYRKLKEQGIKRGMLSDDQLRALGGTEPNWKNNNREREQQASDPHRAGIAGETARPGRVSPDTARRAATALRQDALGHAHLGVTGGVRFRFAGADRPLGWNAGMSMAMPRAFTHKGGVTFAG